MDITEYEHANEIFKKTNDDLETELTTNNEELRVDIAELRAEIAELHAEIAEHKRLREISLKGEKLWATTLASIGDAVIVTDCKGYITFMNVVARELTGWALDDASTRHISEVFNIINEHTRTKVEDPVTRVIKEGIVVGLANHTLLTRKDGTECPIDDSGAPIKDSSGTIIGVVLVFRDITERKRIEKEIQLSEEKYRTLIDNIQDGIFIIQDRKIQFGNDAFARIGGYLVEEIVGMDFTKLVAPEDLEMVTNNYHKRQAKEDVPREYEFRILHKDGNRSIVNMNVGLINYRGRIASMGTVKDITAQKESEEALRQSEAKFASLFRSSPVGMALLNLKDYRFLDVNEKWLTLFGFSREEVVGKVATEIPIWKDRIEQLRVYRHMEMDEIFHNQDCELLKKTGKIWNALVSFEVISIGGNPAILSSVTDVTERKKMEEGLFESRQQLERSNKELGQFAYIASHDLQEPLRSISSFTELLATRYKGRLDSDVDEYIDYITSGSKRMHQMINDLLTLSRIGSRKNEFKPINIKNVIEQSIKNLRDLIEKNRATIMIEEMPTIYADESQLIQLFQNLIENAIKFRKEDIPIIYIMAKKGETIDCSHTIDHNEWIFSIQDNGIGINPNDFKKLFIIFQRLHSRYEYAGTGIGLAICKKIVEHHGGKIWIESAYGIGSTFYFSLPTINKK